MTVADYIKKLQELPQDAHFVMKYSDTYGDAPEIAVRAPRRFGEKMHLIEEDRFVPCWRDRGPHACGSCERNDGPLVDVVELI